MKLRNILAMSAMMCAAAFSQENYAQWSKYADIKVNTSASGANVSNPVTNFPVLVRLTSVNFPDFATAGTKASLRFARGSTQLKYQVDSFDSTGSLGSQIWVSVDSVLGNNATQSIRMYWGKSGAPDSSSGPKVFAPANKFAAVYHLGSSLAELNNVTLSASALNLKSPPSNPTDLAPAFVAGDIGQGLSFNGNGTIGASSAMTVNSSKNDPAFNYVTDRTAHYTLSAWVKKGSSQASTLGMVICKNYQYYLGLNGATNQWEMAEYTNATGKDSVDVPAVSTADGWNYVVGVRNGAGMTLYVNGGAGTTVNFTGVSPGLNRQGGGTFNQTVGIGRDGGGSIADNGVNPVSGSYFNGVIDELHVDSTSRSADWVNLSYRTQSSAQTAVSVGAAQNNVGPAITGLTPADTTVAVGATATFNVAATGTTPLVYQWMKNGSPISALSNPTASTASLVLASVAVGDTAPYTCLVSNSVNPTGVTSGAGNLHLNLGPSIAMQPHDSTVVSGAAAAFKVVASGSGTLSYQWKKNGNNLSNAGTISGATSATLAISAAAITDTGSYAVVVTNTLNGTPVNVTSGVGKLSVNTISISNQPRDTTVLSGVGASFTVGSSGSGTLSYQWKKNGNNLSNAGTVSGATSATLAISAVAATDTGSYTVAVTSTLNGTVNAATSSSGRLFVGVAPSFTTQPHDSTVVSGAAVSFTAAASGSGTLSYQWKKNGNNLSNAGTISGATSATLAISAAAVTDTGSYTVAVTNTLNGTITVATSAIGKLSVNTLAIATQPHDSTAATGLGASFTVVASGSGTLSYQWKKNGTNLSNAGTVSGATSATLAISTVAMTDTGAYTVAVTSALNGTITALTSNAGRLSVVVIPAIVTSPSSASVALGAAVKFSVTAGAGTLPLVYKWLHVHGATTDTLRKDTLSVLTDTLETITSAAFTDTGSYKVIITNSAGSSAPSAAATLTVYTVPGAPTNIVGAGGTHAQIAVTWAAPASNGGSAVLSYKATLVQDTSKHCTATAPTVTCNVTGLASDTAHYSFTVVAINAAGSSAVSTASPAVSGIYAFNAKTGFNLRMMGSSFLLRMPEVSGNVQVSILDLYGRMVWSRTVAGNIGQLSWNGASNQGRATPVGMYVLRLSFVNGAGAPVKAVQVTFVKP